MQAHYPNGSPYRNTFQAFAAVYREGTAGLGGQSAAASVRGGLRSLYRGVDATTVRGIVLSTSQICAYDQAKQSLKRRGILAEGLGLHLTASLFAG